MAFVYFLSGAETALSVRNAPFLFCVFAAYLQLDFWLKSYLRQ